MFQSPPAAIIELQGVHSLSIRIFQKRLWIHGNIILWYMYLFLC